MAVPGVAMSMNTSGSAAAMLCNTDSISLGCNCKKRKLYSRIVSVLN
jgi:hypothetical protein